MALFAYPSGLLLYYKDYLVTLWPPLYITPQDFHFDSVSSASNYSACLIIQTIIVIIRTIIEFVMAVVSTCIMKPEIRMLLANAFVSAIGGWTVGLATGLAGGGGRAAPLSPQKSL